MSASCGTRIRYRTCFTFQAHAIKLSVEVWTWILRPRLVLILTPLSDRLLSWVRLCLSQNLIQEGGCFGFLVFPPEVGRRSLMSRGVVTESSSPYHVFFSLFGKPFLDSCQELKVHNVQVCVIHPNGCRRVSGGRPDLVVCSTSHRTWRVRVRCPIRQFRR